MYASGDREARSSTPSSWRTSIPPIRRRAASCRSTHGLTSGPSASAGGRRRFSRSRVFEFQADIDALPLPTMSPYFGPAIGLHIFAGNLTIGATATVTAGQLDGELQARLTDVRLGPTARRHRCSSPRPIGVPLSTMIASAGRQRRFHRRPAAGQRRHPVTRLHSSGVIWGMLPRAVRALVSSPVRFISATSSLIAASRAGAEAAERPDAVASTGAGGD